MTAHTDLERAHLLRLAGVREDDAAALAAGPAFLIAEEPGLADLAADAAEVDPSGPAVTVELLVQTILAKSKGDKATALRMVDAHVQAEFDRIKLSKLQAAAQGLTPEGKTEHNRNAWARCQKLGEQMKTAVREHHRENGGFVAAKIKGGKA